MISRDDMPASIPRVPATVRNEMLRYLPENWPAIVDADLMARIEALSNG